MRYVPPSVMEESKKILSGSTKAVGVLLFISVIILHSLSTWLSPIVILGGYLWLVPLALFLVFVVLISSGLSKSLRNKHTDIKAEYNRYGDSQLFNFATRKGELQLFDIKKTILMCVIVPFSFGGLVFGILAFHLVLFRGITQFLPLGLIALVVCAGVTFLFLFEDKRILNEARRREQFVDIAQKRWMLSKIIYILLILSSLVCALILIMGNENFLTKGVLESSGRVVYDGRDNTPNGRR